MPSALNINESFICKLWEKSSSFCDSLFTSDGQKLEIISFGKRNFDAGPDYLNTKIKIGSRIFSGDVEVHRDSGGWVEHSHQKDGKYNSVILHVVMWDEQAEVRLRKKRDVATVILSNFLNRSIHDVWQEIINEPSEKLKLPCTNLLSRVEPASVSRWIEKLSDERLDMRKSRLKERIDELLKLSNGKIRSKEIWQQVFYEFIFESLGFSKNKENMMRLAAKCNLRTIKKTLGKDFKIKDVQALLFGMSGLFFDLRSKDDYVSELKQRWSKLQKSILTESLYKFEWNFFRMRPSNFPTIRIAYGSHLVMKILNDDLLKNLVHSFKNEQSSKVLSKINKLFQAEEDGYWNSHYRFGKLSAGKINLIGNERLDDIFINVILPFVKFYSEVFNDALLKEKVSQLYNSKRKTKLNSVLKLMQSQVTNKFDLKIDSPAAEQGLIQLYNFYCMRERCKECSIGKQAFKDGGYDYQIIFY